MLKEMQTKEITLSWFIGSLSEDSYQGYKFGVTLYGHFIIYDTDSKEFDLLDFKTQSEIPLSDHGLIVSDFEGCKLDERGYILVLERNTDINSFKLYVTATGHLYAEHNGLASLVGMPSEYLPLSGPIVFKDGRLKVPMVTAFSKEEMKQFISNAVRKSFNTLKTYEALDDLLDEVVYLNEAPYFIAPNNKGIDRMENLYLEKYPNYFMPEIDLTKGTHYLTILPEEK